MRFLPLSIQGKKGSGGMTTKRRKNPAAVALGRLGGRARTKKLSARKRSDVARIAPWPAGERKSDAVLNLYHKHLSKCPHRAKGQSYTKCSCPIWMYGGGER